MFFGAPFLTGWFEIFACLWRAERYSTLSRWSSWTANLSKNRLNALLQTLWDQTLLRFLPGNWFIFHNRSHEKPIIVRHGGYAIWLPYSNWYRLFRSSLARKLGCSRLSASTAGSSWRTTIPSSLPSSSTNLSTLPHGSITPAQPGNFRPFGSNLLAGRSPALLHTSSKYPFVQADLRRLTPWIVSCRY
jgi:hypothetical protein